MRIIVQRVRNASVLIDHSIKREIEHGLLVLLGITSDDELSDTDWIIRKLLNLRIFADDQGIMNRSVIDISGSIMLISQFTLYASTKKGNRPSYINAAPPAIAEPKYDEFVQRLKAACDLNIQTGSFGSDMQINLHNDGPVTIIIDSKLKE